MAYQPQGAGGTSGGGLQFVIGLIMACAGFFMLLDNIVVSQGFGFGYALYRIKETLIKSTPTVIKTL